MGYFRFAAIETHRKPVQVNPARNRLTAHDCVAAFPIQKRSPAITSGQPGGCVLNAEAQAETGTLTIPTCSTRLMLFAIG